MSTPRLSAADTLHLPKSDNFASDGLFIVVDDKCYRICADRARVHGREISRAETIGLKEARPPSLSGHRLPVVLDFGSFDAVSAVRASLPKPDDAELYTLLADRAFNWRFIADAIAHVGRDVAAHVFPDGAGSPLMLTAPGVIALVCPMHPKGKAEAEAFVFNNNMEARRLHDPNFVGPDEDGSDDDLRARVAALEAEIASLREDKADLDFLQSARCQVSIRRTNTELAGSGFDGFNVKADEARSHHSHDLRTAIRSARMA